MAELKFTPGPWEAWQEAGPNGPWHVHTAEGHIYIGHLPDGAPDEPNARLIAAAPELYAALTEMVAMQDKMGKRPSEGGGVLPADYGIVRGKAHAALAKARGEGA